MTPAISVLMAVRNGGQYLSASIASIVRQSFTDWEMVVVDDASDDATPVELAGWTARDSRIRVMTNASNLGQTAALNKGLHMCRAEWVARQDADDLSSPRRFAAQMKLIAKHPEIALLGTQGILVDENGRKVGLLDVPCREDGIRWTSMFLNPFLHTSVMFRRSVAVEKCGGYDESFRIAQDYDLWVKILNGAPTANLPERLVSYRRSDQSLSRAGLGLAQEEADRVGERQASTLLGRALSNGESALAADFRRGLPTSRRGAFHQMRRELAEEFNRRHPEHSSGPRSVQAQWHLRLAGAGGCTLAALSEVSAALASDPIRTLRWFQQRLC